MDPIVERELAADAARPSAGALLRAARERQGMHAATLAAAIKVSALKIEALEDDRWDELPGPTFTRALAQAVCRVLKIDPRPVLVLLPPADTSMLDSTVGSLNEPFAGRPGGDPGAQMMRPGPIGLAAAVLLVAAFALWFAPKGWFGRLTGAGTGAPAPGASAAAPRGGTSSEGSAERAILPAATAAPERSVAVPAFPAVVPGAGSTVAATSTTSNSAPPTAAAPHAAPVAVPGAPPSAPPSALPAAPPAPPPALPPAVARAGAPAPGAAPALPPAIAAAAPQPLPGAAAVAQPASAASVASGLVMRSTAPSWIEVRDGLGRLLASRTLEPGDPLSLAGSPPLQVVVGNAAATQVIWKGRPVVLTPVGRDNVARVELR